MGPKGSMFEGRTLDDAVRKGLDSLGLSRAEVTINVVEEGSGGFLGFGARPYKVIITPRPGGPPRDDDDRDRDRRGARGRREGGREGRRGRSDGAAARGDRNGRGRRGSEGRGSEGRGGERGRGDRPERRGARRGEDRPREAREPRAGREAREPREGRDAREPQGSREARELREGRAPREPQRPREAREPHEEREAAAPAPAAVFGAGEEDAIERRRRRRGRRGGRGRRGERRAEGPAGDAPEREPQAGVQTEAQVERERAESLAPVTTPAASLAPGLALPPAAAPAMGAYEPPQEAWDESSGPDERESASSGVERERAGGGAAEESMDAVALAESGRRWTEDLLRAMGFEAKVTAVADGDRVDVTVEVSERDELLTGPKGEVRQAMQHLLNRMVNRGEGSRYHLQLEINDFWKQREDELRALARDLAQEALDKNDEVVTEYLNSQERRIVHVTLRDHERVKTYALGTGMIKRVAIAPADFPEGDRADD